MTYLYSIVGLEDVISLSKQFGIIVDDTVPVAKSN